MLTIKVLDYKIIQLVFHIYFYKKSELFLMSSARFSNFTMDVSNAILVGCVMEWRIPTNTTVANVKNKRTTLKINRTHTNKV